MNLASLNRQQKLALFAGLAVALLAGEYFVRAPLWRSWTARSARITSLKKQVDDGTSMINRDAAILGTWEHMRTNTLSREVSIAQSQVLRAFDSWSRESGVSVGGIRPQWKRDNDLQTLECRADVTGTLPALTRFLYQAELDPLGIRIESVEITVRDKSGDQLALALQVSALQLGEAAR